MKKLLIFDPPQCCSTGICGPDVDPKLVQFAADLKWIQSQGIPIERYNLGQQPEAFAQNDLVLKILNESGTEVLPLIICEDMVVSQARYPIRSELARMADLEESTIPMLEEFTLPVIQESIFSAAVAELVAIGAAIGSNCEECFDDHYSRASALGVSREDMIRAVNVAQTVTEKQAEAMRIRASRVLNPDSLTSRNAGCCGSDEECC